MSYKTLNVNEIELEVYENGDIYVPLRRVEFWNGHIIQTMTHPRRKLTPVKNGKAGYYQVHVCRAGKKTARYVHRIVWQAFKGDIPEGFEIDHLDDVKSNNALSNLDLKTHKDNMKKMRERNSHTLLNLVQNRTAL